MKYPVLSLSNCAELSRQLYEGFHPTIDNRVDWLGSGDSLELGQIGQLASELLAETGSWSGKDRDISEGIAATRLYAVLNGTPIHILDDRGFWRYLSLRYFWDFIAWREERPFQDGNYLKYVDAAQSTEAVLPRMYLRAQVLAGTNDEELAGSIPRAGDFWRSHILRVRTGSAPQVARAFAAKQHSSRLSTKPLRETAKRLNRTWTNIVLDLYDKSEAEELIDDLWAREVK